MKKLAKIFGILLTVAVATSCSSTFHTTAYVDDIYYSPGVVRAAASQQTADRGQTRVIEVVEEDYARPVEQAYGEEAYEEKVVINNFYVDSYHDFAYTSRIRRFHRHYGHFGYYDPFYTNMFFYTFHPLYYGASIYYGYGAFPMYYGYNPAFFHHHMSWNRYLWGMGWYGGFPYAHGYRHNYWMGYHAGFYQGLWAGGYNPYMYGHGSYIYNSFDRDSYHFGHMGSGGSTVGRRTATRGDESFAERFESRTIRDDSGRRQILAEERVVSGRELASRDNGRTDARPEQATASRTRVNEQEVNREVATRPARAADPDTERVIYQPARRPEDYRAPSREQYEGGNIQRYVRPQQAEPGREVDRGASNYTVPRTYTPPSYQQPGSPQRARPAAVTPGTENRPAAQPTRTDRGRPSYTPPQQQPTRTTTTPSRTTTAPARSTTPSRTTTAPARTTPPPSRSTPPPSRTTTTTRSAPPPSSSSGTSSSSGSRNTSSGGRRQ